MKTKKRTPVAHKPTKQVEHKRRHIRIYVALTVALAVVGGLIGWAAWFYGDRAMPNVAIGSVVVSNQPPSAIREAIAAQAPALSITFDEGGKLTTVAAKDLGVVVDVEATLQNALKAKRSDPLQSLAVWQPTTIPLVLANDPGVLLDYAHRHFSSAFVDPKEPEVVFNAGANQFEVTPGVPGKGLDVKSFERALPDLAKRPQGFTLKLTALPVPTLLDQSKLEEVRGEANQRIKQSVEFKLGGEVISSAKPADIAGWMHFVPDTTTGKAALEIDKAKVQQFLIDTVGPTVAAPPIDRKIVVDSQTGAQTVLQPGRAGSQIRDVETMAGDVVAALQDNKSISHEVSITTAPFKTVTMSGTGKWIEVDLSKQRLTMYIGDTPVKSVLVSTGKANTPTSIGESAIYSKTPSMTMTGTIAGDYYYLPNVKWVSFFNGGEALHGTYWHHNFGHPMSHGCVNMTEADAKVLYDFAPIGTKVIVHA